MPIIVWETEKKLNHANYSVGNRKKVQLNSFPILFPPNHNTELV